MVSQRVLLCLTSLEPSGGGIAAVNRNVVRALPARDAFGRELEVRALVYHGGAPRLGPGYRPGRGRFEAEGCGSRRARLVSRFLYLCLAWRPGLVFVDHLHLAVVPYLFRPLLPHGYVLFCHGTEFDGQLSRLRQAAYRGAALRLSNSRFTAARLECLFPGAAVEPCELGLDELALPFEADDPLPPLPDAHGDLRLMGDRAALIVGRVLASERYKGHDQLIDALPQVLRRVPAAQLVVAGDGDDLERLKARAREAGVGRAVLFAGFAAPDLLAGLFARCRVFTMPSRGEGFGLVYLEAMRFGKPCLASCADAGGEVVADGETGLLVDPLDLGQIAEAVVRLLSDDALTARLGRAARQRLDARYRFHHFQGRLRERLARLAPGLIEAELQPV